MWSLKLKIQFNWRDIPFIFQDLNKIYCSGQCLGSIKFWCGSGSGSWIGTGKKMDPDPSHFSNFLFYFFSLIFILKLDEPFRNQKIFIISLFKSSDLGFRSKKVLFCSFWLIFYPLDPGSQNLANPTDQDHKHYLAKLHFGDNLRTLPGQTTFYVTI